MLASAGRAIAQPADADKDPAAILEIGAAPGWSFTDHAWSLGPTVAVEVTPVENWLELEAGVTAAVARHSTEWSTDLLFKKPWTLSKHVEFMIGAGPEWIHTRSADTIGGEVALDFMFWPTAKHRFGWYLEPAYDYNFGRGHEKSIGISAGLLIAIH